MAYVPQYADLLNVAGLHAVVIATAPTRSHELHGPQRVGRGPERVLRSLTLSASVGEELAQSAAAQGLVG